MIANNYSPDGCTFGRCPRCGKIRGICHAPPETEPARAEEVKPPARAEESRAADGGIAEAPAFPLETPPAEDIYMNDARADAQEMPAREAACGEKPPEEGLFGRGLYHYRLWWERSDADIFVNGEMISGLTIFTDANTLRVVNEKYSYFIPLEKVDYIRTDDGLLKNP